MAKQESLSKEAIMEKWPWRESAKSQPQDTPWGIKGEVLATSNQMETWYIQPMMQDYGRKTMEFFSALDKYNPALIDTFYDAAVEYSDPLGQGAGRLELHRHYARLFKYISQLRYEFGPVISEGRKVAVTWTATIRHSRLNGGREISLRGSTWLEFGGAEDKVIRFGEYFDLGELAYENLPILGFATRKVKNILRTAP
jgi:hypothetical protein